MPARPLRWIHRLLLAAVVGGLAWWHATYIGEYELGGARVWWSLLFVLLLWVGSYAAGVPDVPARVRTAAVRSFVAAIGAASVISVLQLVVGTPLLPRLVVGLSVVLAVPVGAVLTRLSTGPPSQLVYRVFIVGDDTVADRLAADIANRGDKWAEVVGRSTAQSLTVAGDTALLDSVAEHHADLVVLDRTALATPAIVVAAAKLHEQGARVRSVVAFCEEVLGIVPMYDIDATSLLTDIGELHDSAYVRAKRSVDILLALVGLVVLVPVALVIGLLNPVANRGKLLYVQKRVGRSGISFTIVKFRTMVASQGKSEWTEANDARVTRLGRVLRRTHIDELPQVLNVLFGDLSIVGPRPEQPQYVEKLSEDIPFYGVRHLARPGITGWAQVNHPYGSTVEDAFDKLQYDVWYIRHQSVATDLRIVARTGAQLLGRGR